MSQKQVAHRRARAHMHFIDVCVGCLSSDASKYTIAVCTQNNNNNNNNKNNNKPNKTYFMNYNSTQRALVACW